MFLQRKVVVKFSLLYAVLILTCVALASLKARAGSVALQSAPLESPARTH